MCVLGTFRGQNVPSLFLDSHSAVLRKVFSTRLVVQFFYGTDVASHIYKYILLVYINISILTKNIKFVYYVYVYFTGTFACTY